MTPRKIKGEMGQLSIETIRKKGGRSISPKSRRLFTKKYN